MRRFLEAPPKFTFKLNAAASYNFQGQLEDRKRRFLHSHSNGTQERTEKSIAGLEICFEDKDIEIRKLISLRILGKS